MSDRDEPVQRVIAVFGGNACPERSRRAVGVDDAGFIAMLVIRIAGFLAIRVYADYTVKGIILILRCP